MAVRIGDLVILRSGGPMMTVYPYGPHYIANCEWFVGEAPWPML